MRREKESRQRGARLGTSRATSSSLANTKWKVKKVKNYTFKPPTIVDTLYCRLAQLTSTYMASKFPAKYPSPMSITIQKTQQDKKDIK